MYRSHPHDPQQGELCTAPRAEPGTKLSQHAHTSSPTGTKLSQHTHTSSPTGTKLSQHVQKGPFQPVLLEQGELCTAATTKKPSRENFVPHQAPNPVQNSPSAPVLQRFREKVRPAHPHQQPNRYKTLPTRTKRPISACFARAGRTLYRFHPHDPQQGELCTAPRAKPGTKLSQHAHTSSPPGTKLSPLTPSRAPERHTLANPHAIP